MRIIPAFLFAALVMVAAGCKPGGSTTSKDPQIPHIKELDIKDTVVGKGDPVARGDDIWVLYTGRLMSGKVFDTNIKEGGKLFHVTVGTGQVIKGWDQGLLGMKQGGKRKLTIPYMLAYGEKGNQGIPPASDLVFEVELRQVLKQKDAGIINANDLKIGTGREAKDGDSVTIDYVAKADGEEFDTQKDVKIKIGADDVQIASFDKALIGMKVGGQREIIIPPMLTRMLGNEKLGMNVGIWTVTLKAISK